MDDEDGDLRIEIIRKRGRDLVKIERQNQRLTIVIKKRAALGDIVDDEKYSEAFVAAKAAALKKKTLSTEEYQHLQNALIQNKDNIYAFLKVDYSLGAITRDLSSKNSTSQLNAATVCCNIALGDVKTCKTLAKKIVPYLIMALDGLNYPLLEICAWTIGNLVTGSKRAFEILHAQGCLKRIISLLNDCDGSIYPSILYAATHYLHAAFKNITEAEVIELIKALIKRNDFCKDSNFMWLLGLLSSFAPANIYILNILPTVIDNLYDSMKFDLSDVSQVTATIQILGNTVCEPTGQAADMLLNNPKYLQIDLINLVNKLLSHKYDHVQKETLWLLGNLYNHPLPQFRLTINNILPVLSVSQAMRP